MVLSPELEARKDALPSESQLDVDALILSGMDAEAAISRCEKHAQAQAEAASKPAKVKAHVQGREVSFPDVEPWPYAVDGAALLSSIRATFLRFLALPDGAVEALTLWALHAHAHDLGDVSPILCLKSPAMRCGKTSCLRIMSRLVPRPLASSNITSSPLFRSIEKYRPTLLVDEADSFARDNEELRGILNSGHERENAVVVRAVGKDFEPRAFPTWAPKAMASIGALAETLEDRSITIPMRRRAKGETVERLRIRRLAELEHLRRKAARWIEDHADELANADPDVPETLDDRCADNWMPLLAIADLAGGEWPKDARRAALILSGERAEERETKEELLADIRSVWPSDEPKIHSANLVKRLVDMDGRPWIECNRGRALTQTGLADLLRGFVPPPKLERIGGEVKRGYERHAFEDAFLRYLTCNGNLDSVTGPVTGGVTVQIEADYSLQEPNVTGVTVPQGGISKGDAWEPEVEP